MFRIADKNIKNCCMEHQGLCYYDYDFIILMINLINQ